MHTNKKRKFENPWADTEGFIDLGYLAYQAEDGDHYYELYALVNRSEPFGSRNIDFGARYGDEGSFYLSGSAYLTKSWEIVSASAPILLAMARYFANHHSVSKAFRTKRTKAFK